MKMMKKNFLYKTVILSGLLMVFSCDQSPIFYKVSTETIPEKPRIPGAPTKMVEFNRNGVPIMYVASGGLHWYARKNGGTGISGWDSPDYSIPQLDDKVIDLAVTDSHLYALSISSSGTTTTLRRITSTGNDWKEFKVKDGSMYTSIQSIHADPDKDCLFAGVMNNKGEFGIFYLLDSGNSVLQPLVENTEMLSGAAFLGTSYYLSTRGKGVYSIGSTLSPGSVTRLSDGENPDRIFMGMIKFTDQSGTPKIIVVERNGGTFFEVRGTGFRQIKYKGSNDSVATDKYATGALAIWENINNPSEKMFVAGIQGGLYITSSSTSYTHGYTEFELNFIPDPSASGWLVLDSTRRDTTPDLTVTHNKDRYSATIGKHPINHMYQTPDRIDTNRIFFASTQTGGLWSYRERDDGIQWNAEGENEP